MTHEGLLVRVAEMLEGKQSWMNPVEGHQRGRSLGFSTLINYSLSRTEREHLWAMSEMLT